MEASTEVLGDMDSPVTHSIETVTPEQAIVWLEDTRPSNRKVSDGRVRELARIIQSGQWMLNGQPIIFNCAGKLLDGQHRLRAIMAADTPVICSIVRNVSDNAMTTIDTGRSRVGADVLRMHGFVNTLNLAAATALVRGWKTETATWHFGAHAGIRPQELLDELADTPELVGYLASADTIVPSTIAAPSIITFAHWLFATDDPALAETFLARLGDGVGLEANDPIYRCRELLLSIRTRKTQIRRTHVIAYIIKAWNLWRLGRPCKHLRIIDAEQFPVPVGCRVSGPNP